MATAKKVVRRKKTDEVQEPQVTEVVEVSENSAVSAESFVEPRENSATPVKSDITVNPEEQNFNDADQNTNTSINPITTEAESVQNTGGAQADRPAESSDYRPRYSRPTSNENQSLRPASNYDSSNQRGGYSRGSYDRNDSSSPARGYSNSGYNNNGYDNSNRQDRRFGQDSSAGPRTGRYDRAESPRFERDTEEEIQVPVKGILDIQHEGHGFLRPKFRSSDKDIYISSSQIRRFWLRNGDLVEGVGRPPKDTERYFGLLKIETVNGAEPEKSLTRPNFDDLTAIYPDKQVLLNTGKEPLSTRIIDLVSPIGFGQRGMIVSPPKAGKTTIMKNIAEGISANFPDVHLMAILIGERPEEVTDISRSVKGEVVASNFDESPETQTRIAEIAMDRAKRLVEEGKQVVVLLDSITRLARAYNLAVDPSGRTLSGGFDPAALYPAKKFFGAARNCEEGGSLTIIGTALVDTGSRMDDLIFEEFKGTGNMEVHLDRRLADRRVFPAINIERSGTREEARILPEDVLKKVILLRRMIDVLNPEERTEVLIERLQKTADNVEFLESLAIPKE